MLHALATPARGLAAPLAIAILLLPAATAAQVRLPSQPGASFQPALKPVEPLQIVEAPSGDLMVPVLFGWRGDNSLAPRIRTTGGKGTVTLSVEVAARPAQAFRLVDPPAIGDPRFQLATQQSTVPTLGNGQAANLHKVLAINGFNEIPRNFPAPHEATIVARDSSGATVRRTFRVVYTRADGGPPRFESASKTFTPDGIERAELTPAQLAVTPNGEVITRRENLFTLRRSNTAGINWHIQDPQTEVICSYGGFRYACDIGSGMAPFEMPRTLDVKVPNIGRGLSVGIILKNPYGESAPITVAIDTVVTVTRRQKHSFLTPTAGKVPFQTAPAVLGSSMLERGRTKPCDRTYLVWKDLTTDGKMYAAGAIAGVADLKFAGDASVRVVSVPRGQAITDNVDASWADMEFNLPAGLAQAWQYDVTYSYETRLGECPARRR